MRLNRLARPALVLVASLALGACGSVTTPPAAIVNGAEVSRSDLLDEAGMIAGSEALRGQQESQGAQVVGETEGSFDAGFVANLLQVRVFVALIEDELDRRGITVGTDELDASRERLIEQFGGEAALAQFPAGFLEAQARQEAVITALGGELVGDAETLFEENPEQFAELCVSHIFVSSAERSPEESAARAEELDAALEGGATFEQLATEQSDDPAAAARNGDLECGGRGRFIPEFEEAAFALDEGEISDPVQTPVGYHIIRVDQRNERTFEEAEAEVTASIQTQIGPAIQQFVADASGEADVEVDPRFGTWTVTEGQAGQVVPPEGPTQTEPLEEPVLDPTLEPEPQQ